MAPISRVLVLLTHLVPLAPALLLALPAHAAKQPARDAEEKPLSETARATLRSRLEKIYFEQDLLVRNHSSDLSNLRRQQLEFDTLKVFLRIPFKEDWGGLKTSLRESSSDHGLKLVSFSPLPKPKVRIPAVPAKIMTDHEPPFRLGESQLIEKLPFTAVVQGERSAVNAWMRSWPEDQMRLTEPAGPDAGQAVRPRGKNRWEIRAHAFRFREVKFPALEPRDPIDVLPAWARQEPDRFAEAEPALWRFVQKTRAISPRARPLFKTREQLLLNGARMAFFLSKATRNPAN